MKLLIVLTLSCLFNLQRITHGTITGTYSMDDYSYTKLNNVANRDGIETAPNEVHKNRLPRDLLPSRYQLFVKPDLDGDQPPFPFNGKVTIYFKCTNATKVLTLTSKDLNIKESSIKFTAPSEISVPKFKSLKHDVEKSFIVIEVDGEFKKDFSYSVSIEFSGVMKEDSIGLYAARYRDVDDKIKYLAATQLEPIGFRRLTPGFDEVDMKATFDVVVARRAIHTSLSNTQLLKNNFGPDGWVHDSFETSPVMSPYLLCIVVGDLKYLEAPVEPGRKLKVRSYTTPALLEYIYHPNMYYTYPLQKWLEEETQIPYLLKKMDHMTLLTFGGAMENWGLITYAEDIFPVSNVTSSANGLFRSSFIISHELTHMWFGNLVTCEWWTHLWLQEALASYYNTYPLQALGWEGSELHQSIFLIDRMRDDQRNTSDPIRISIEKPQDAFQAFADSTYYKGACLIRMLKQIITEPVHKKALTRYLKTYQYSNANSDQFLQVFTDQAKESGIRYPDGSEINFKKLVDPWLDQKGFPLLKVIAQDKGLITVTQSRYFNPVNQHENVQSPYKYKWDVPIHVLSANSLPSDWSKPPNYWLRASQESIQIKVPEKSWFIINPNQMFFYRVWYDKDQRASLANNILKLPVESRTQIIDDAFDLSRNGYFPATDAFDNTLLLGMDPSYNSWSVTLKHAHDVEPFFRERTWYPSYRHYFSTLLHSVLSVVGYEFKPEDTLSTQFLRRDAISTACWFGNLKCLDYAHQIFEDHKLNPDLNSINANILPSVLCTEVAKNPEKNYEFVSNEYKKREKTRIKEEKLSYAYAMTCSPRKSDIDVIFKDLTNEGGFFSHEDVSQVADYLAGNKYGADLLWEYLDESWSEVNPNLSKMRLVGTITRPWFSEMQLRELKSFVRRRPANEQGSFSHHVLAVEQNNWFYNNNERSLGIWFGQQQEQGAAFAMAPSAPFNSHVFTSPFEIWGSSLKLFKDKILDAKRKRMKF